MIVYFRQTDSEGVLQMEKEFKIDDNHPVALLLNYSGVERIKVFHKDDILYDYTKVERDG